MEESGRDCVSVRIECMVNDLPSFTLTKPVIDEVDHLLKQVNEKDFEPQIVSIGPIHHGKVHLKSMEQHKVRYLRQVLARRVELSIEKCVSEVRNMEEKARLYYPKSLNLDQDEFVQMMLLDGCFVTELLRSYSFNDLRDRNDQIFQSDHVLTQVRHDLMLLENQLPFFVLKELFDMTKMEDPEDSIPHLLHFFVGDMFPWSNFSKLDSRSDVLHNADHLLGLVYQSCFSSSAMYFTENNGYKKSKMVHYTSSASELKDAGIRLKGYERMSPWNISFVNGVINVPSLDISVQTESMLRNLIAYELPTNDHPKYVTDYVFLMHCLIRSNKDAEIIRRNGIISNYVGGDETIYRMFNRLGKNVVISSSHLCYSNVFESLNRFDRVRGMTKVKMNYLKNPWKLISFTTDVLLIILTFIQTVVSVLSYRR